jgi:glucose-6-phosphate isomerase
LACLIDLANAAGLREKIDAMFRGDKINITENRAVLHTALRAPRSASIVVDGVDVVQEVHAVLDRMADFSNRVRSGEWKGHTGQRIKNIVNIGIGGSDLGPVMAYEALRHYTDRSLTFRFVSNVDGTDFAEATRDLNPAETLFIISSKTFTTLETMTNAATAREWSLSGLGWRSLPPSRSTSSPSPQMPKRFPHSASTPQTCSASGIGSEVATPWTPRSAYRT